MRTMKSLLAVVALLALGTASARAQGVSGNITATAVVFTPLAVTGAGNLDFGNVFPGVNKTVLSTGAGAGRFDVTGQANASVQVSFTLPPNLTGPASLPIGTWTAGRNTVNTQAGQTTFNPSVVESTVLSGAGALFVWVGATVSPAAGQVGGTYNGTVTMTVAYF